MDSIQLSQLWTVAGILAGFQVAALTWRIKREIQMEKEREITWLTVPDLIVGLSFLTIAIGVFVGPIAGSFSKDLATKLFGVAVLAFAAYPFVLVGHYNLYGSWQKELPRPWFTTQEGVALLVSAVLVAGGVLWIFY